MEITTKEQKFTELGKGYWNETGVYQKEYSELYEKFVPNSGMADTLNGELIRAVSRIVYEYNNNGNCNACEVNYETETYHCNNCNGTGEVEDGYDEDGEEEYCICDECGGAGEIEEEYEADCEVSGFYGAFLELIETTIPESKDYVEKVIDNITANLYGADIQFSELNTQKYNNLVDIVVHYVLNNEDKEIPTWYSERMN